MQISEPQGAHSCISRKNALVAAGVLVVIAIAIASWALTVISHHQSNLKLSSNDDEQPLLEIGKRSSAFNGDKEYGDLWAALDSEDYALSLKLLKSLEKRFPARVEEIDELRGLVFWRLNFYEDAIAADQRALKLKPDSAPLWYALGAAYNGHGETEKAISASQRALEINPQFADAWFLLGTSYLTAKQPDNAVQPLQRFVALKPADSLGWFFLGVAYEDIGKLDAAVDAFQHSTKLKPDFVDSWADLGRCYWKQNKTNDAVVTLQHAISIKPNYEKLWALLASVYKDSGQTQKASEAFERFKALSPEKP